MGPSPVKEAFAGRPTKLMCEMAFFARKKMNFNLFIHCQLKARIKHN